MTKSETQSADKRPKIWFFLAKEFDDLVTTFALLFDGDNFIRDYENVWEWIEGYSKKYQARINISRDHDWNSGRHDKVIMMLIDFDNPHDNTWATIEIIAKHLFDTLSVNIFFGQSTLNEDDNYTLLEIGEIAS